MSEHVRTRSQSSERENDEESSQPVEAVIVQQPTEEKCQVEPPTENQGITPSGEIKSEGAPAVQEPDVEAIPQELALLKIEDESGDGPDIRMGILPTFDLTTVLEAGMLFNKMQIIGFLFSQYYVLHDTQVKLLLF
uniref:GAGE domain-containing protein n=1 Tax=Aotus nancymaae TaxID=37293 RepID=A0A2K5CHD2_AOTNA